MMSPNSGLVPQSDRSVSGLGVDSGVGVSGSGFGAGQSGGDNQVCYSIKKKRKKGS